MQTEQKAQRFFRQFRTKRINQAGVGFVRVNSVKEAAFYTRSGRADLILFRSEPTIDILTKLIEQLGGALTVGRTHLKFRK